MSSDIRQRLTLLSSEKFLLKRLHTYASDVSGASVRAFFSKRTLYQLIAYFLVGIFEWFTGFYIYHHLEHLTGFIAFGIQSIIVGFIAFLLRKYLVFKA